MMRKVHDEVLSRLRQELNTLRKVSCQGNQPLSLVVKRTAIGGGGLGFDFRIGQIGHSGANKLPLLRGFFGDVLPKH